MSDDIPIETGNPMPVFSETERRKWLEDRQRAEDARKPK